MEWNDFFQFIESGQEEIREDFFQFIAEKSRRYFIGAHCSHENVEDLVQEFCIKVNKVAENISKHKITRENARPYFYKIMENVLIDYLRKEKKHERSPQPPSPKEITIDGDTYKTEAILLIMYECIGELPDEWRNLVLLRMDCNVEEIVAKTGKSARTVRRYISKSKEQLKNCINGKRQ